MMPFGLFFFFNQLMLIEMNIIMETDLIRSKEGLLTIEKLQTNTEEPFKLICESQHKRKLILAK